MTTTLTVHTTHETARAPCPLLFPGMPLDVQAVHGFLTNLHGLNKPYTLGDLGTANARNRTHDQLIADEAEPLEKVVIWDGGLSSEQLPSQLRLRSQLSVGSASIDLRPGDFTLANNSFCLLTSRLDGPELIDMQGTTELCIRPVFELDYTTRYFPAQLSELRMVESQRFLTLENGNTIVLTHTDDLQGSALIMGNPDAFSEDERLLTQIFEPLSLLENKNFCAVTKIGQKIFSEYCGEEVATFTVMEKYTSYFLQRYCSLTEQGCWVPASAPVTWGWSIRVGKNVYGDWAIVRRKLMLPTVGHEGLQLPHWKSSLKISPYGHLE